MSDSRIKNFTPLGIFEATLKKDFILTIEETGLPYCEALIPEFYQDDGKFPYTWIPFGFFMTFPLKAGDIIWVQFMERDTRLPVLVGVKSCALLGGESIPSVWKDFKDPQGGSRVKPPNFDDTATFRYEIISKDIYTLYQQDRVIRRVRDTVTYQTTDSMYVFGSSSIQAYARKFDLEGNEFTIGSAADTLGSLIKELIEILEDFDTVGSPGSHSTGPGSLVKLQLLKPRWDKVFK